MVRGVRIVFRIAVRVVHPVQNGISTGTQIRGTLGNPGQAKEKLFPKWIHREHLVRGVPMQEEGLAKQRQVPVSEE